MTSIWNAGINTMMQVAGKLCRVNVDGATIEFQGILDQAEIADETEFGTNVRMAAVIRVTKEIAQKLKGKTNVAVEVDDVEYIMQEPIAEDDGLTSVCPIYPRVDTERLGWT